LSNPTGLAFDSSGNLYAANANSSTIEEFAYSGGTLNKDGTIFAGSSSGLNTPLGLAFDGSNNLYVANFVGNTIEEFAFNGGMLNANGTTFASSGLNNPAGLAFDSSGNLYVANNFNATIEKFSSTGNDLDSFAATVSKPTFLAFQPPFPMPLYLQLTGTNLVLTWTNALFNLQAAPAVAGSYTNIPGAISPYTNAITGSQQFFRLQAN
jgi:DNA-binding beta-propeller fold protein YncE